MSAAQLLYWLAWLGAAIGSALILRALFADRSRNRPRCPACFYDLPGAAVPCRCPECGREITHATHLHRTRRHGKHAALASLLVIASWLAGSWLPIQQDGWATAFPNWALRPLLPLTSPDYQDLMTRSAAPGGLRRWDRLLLAESARRDLRLYLQAPERGGPDPNDNAFDRALYACVPSGAEAAIAIDEWTEVCKHTRGLAKVPAQFAAGAILSIDTRGNRSCEVAEFYVANAVDPEVQCSFIAFCFTARPPLASTLKVTLLAIFLKSRDPVVVTDAAQALARESATSDLAFKVLRDTEAAVTDETVRNALGDAIQEAQTIRSRTVPAR